MIICCNTTLNQNDSGFSFEIQNQNNEKIIENTIKSSDQTATLSIDGDSEAIAFFSGNISQDGLSPETAFTLKDVIVSVQPDKMGIRIRNTALYIHIKNCSLIGNEHTIFMENRRGIDLNSVSNIQISNSSFFGLKEGIYVNNSLNVAILSSNFSECVDTAIVIYSEDLQIINNHFLSNFVCIFHSNKIIFGENNVSCQSYFSNITNGNIYANSFRIVTQLANSREIFFCNNDLKGTYLSVLQNTDSVISFNTMNDSYAQIKNNNNTVYSFNNMTNGNGYDYGIHIFPNIATKIHHNIVSGQKIANILFEKENDEPYALLYENIFENSPKTMEIGSISPELDNGEKGNYWGDYLSQYPEAEIDGDHYTIPYQPNSTLMNYDNFPLVSRPSFIANYSIGEINPAIIDYYANHNWVSIPIITDSYFNLSYVLKLNNEIIAEGKANKNILTVDIYEVPAGLQNFTLVVRNYGQFAINERIFNISILVKGMPPSSPVWKTNNFATSKHEIIIEWNSVQRADRYNIYLNGEYYATSINLHYTIILATIGDYFIHLSAVNDLFGESDLSAILWVSITAEPISPPNTNNSSDEELNTYTITLLFVGVFIAGLLTSFVISKAKGKNKAILVDK